MDVSLCSRNSTPDAAQGHLGSVIAFFSRLPGMNSNAKIDALELMLTDLRTRNEPIRHKAAFRGCQPEFQALVSRLIEQLESELLDEKHRFREASRSVVS